jgi:peptidyl-tRNA hydrolase, PTH1 family
MKLIVGLGNPGVKYKQTRHNTGFLAVDFLVSLMTSKKPDFKNSKSTKNSYQKVTYLDQEIEFIKPQTFMNMSGVAIMQVAKKNNIKPEDIIVIHDELDLYLGNFKVKKGGSSAGNNGIKSVIEYLGSEDFWRIRIGISNNLREEIPADKFVLNKFSKEEIKTLEETIFPELKTAVEKLI